MIEIATPNVIGSGGAAKAFAFSWWAIVSTTSLNQETDVKDFIYSEETNMMECQIAPRGVEQG